MQNTADRIYSLYTSQVIELLELEAKAISRAATRLQADQLERAFELFVSCSGKVILLGVGKSGMIACKIAATLTSTGTPAMYLHASDALHGDIGIATQGDVAVAISNSGETDELLAILPHLKNRQVPIIAIVGNLNSTLARHADATLDASVEREACPFNLAPTASTTVALAIGDALAISLMNVKGMTPENFAFNHPAGRLGKRLTLRVSDLMHGGTANPTVPPHIPWLEVVGAIGKGGLGAVSVVESCGQLIGIITDGDVRRCAGNRRLTELEYLEANSMMTANPVVTSPEVLAYDALRLMEERPAQISVLPVVDHECRCVGLLRLHDIVRSGI